MCCKNYFETSEVVRSISLCGEMEEALDKLRLGHRSMHTSSIDLTFAYHVHSFNAFQSSFNCMETLEGIVMPAPSF